MRRMHYDLTKLSPAGIAVWSVGVGITVGRIMQDTGIGEYWLTGACALFGIAGVLNYFWIKRKSRASATSMAN